MKKVIWSLFDGSGIMAKPWADAGHKCYCFNADDADHGSYDSFGAKIKHDNIQYINVWIDADFTQKAISGAFGPLPDIIFSFPPCTDLAVSGAAHFARKREANPEFQREAVRVCRAASRLAKKIGAPFMIENPVSVLSSMWRRPDYTFHPYEYGGYLPRDDRHPFFPELIKPRDAYPKKTCLWAGNGFIMPRVKPVAVEPGYSDQHNKLGGKSVRTKTIRSLTPRGFAAAVYEENK